jgi:hypothetical protein
MTFGFRASLKVNGPQFLVNRWAKTFLTPKGTNPLDRSEGTSFGGLLGTNIDAYDASLEDVLILSIEDANDQIRAQDLKGLFPEEERLANATLLRERTVIGRDYVSVWVRIVNVAGRVLPVRLVDLATTAEG